MNRKRRAIIALACLLLLTGCWNRQEINEQAYVLAVGVDQAPHGAYRISFQYVNPGEVATQQAAGAGKVPAVTVYSATGNTLVEAIRNASRFMPRRLFFGSCRLLVISEAVARKGILDLFDLIERDPELRTTIKVVVARGTQAKWILTSLTALEKIPAMHIGDTLQITERVLAETIDVDVDQVISAIASKGREPVISGVQLAGNASIIQNTEAIQQSSPPAILQLNGIALFKGAKLIDWMDLTKARGFMWTQNRIKSTILKLNCKRKKGTVAIEVSRTRSDVQVKMTEGKPIIQLRVKMAGNVKEVDCPLDISRPETMEQLEKEAKDLIRREIIQTVKTVQAKQMDIFGFGEDVYRTHPKQWHQMEKNWNRIFSQVPVQVTVNVYLRRTGLSTKPYMVD